jgi:hypothetical protein
MSTTRNTSGPAIRARSIPTELRDTVRARLDRHARERWGDNVPAWS